MATVDVKFKLVCEIIWGVSRGTCMLSGMLFFPLFFLSVSHDTGPAGRVRPVLPASSANRQPSKLQYMCVHKQNGALKILKFFAANFARECCVC